MFKVLEAFSDFIRDYTFEFQESQIATRPLEERGTSRLLLVRRNPTRGLPRFEDLLFRDLPQVIENEDELKKMLWVRNRSKVFWARVFAHRASGSRHEILFIKKISDDNNKSKWSVLIKNSAKLKFPEVLSHKITALSPNLVEVENVENLFEAEGRVPLPPYIKREAEHSDRAQYQPVWADGEAKSAASPTASLHFSEEMWCEIEQRGIRSADVYLHVGLGTFEPVRVDRLSEHRLHAEDYELGSESLAAILKANSCLAVGTTACRLVETVAREKMLSGATSLFVRPGFEFQKTRALLTNFHLPESTLYVLVNVFAGSMSLAREAYSYALRRGYRLFSYGDASLWV